MPSRQRVQDLVSRVERGELLDAFEEFYADDITMRENTQPPTTGKAANREREQQFVASVKEVHEARAESLVVEGDRAAIHWILDYTAQDGNRYRMDQIAYQTWRGDQIVSEQFFYDTGSLVQG